MSLETSRKIIRYGEKPIYPSAYDALRQVLLDDALVRDFVEIKQHAALHDHHRPAYHFINAFGFMNDPNGFCYYNGRYHLFYQQYANAPDGDATIYWGHAVSKNLLEWLELPYAIHPDPEAQCWSGTVCTEEGRACNIYYGFGGAEGVYCAVSEDPLLVNWTKVGDGPAIPRLEHTTCPHWYTPDKNSPQPFNVFDPCIWKQGDTYFTLTGGTKYHPISGSKVRSEFLYTSNDLQHWTYLGQLTDGDSFIEVDDDGACPYFLPIEERQLLLYYSHMNGPRWLLGDYDAEGLRFTPCNGGRITATSKVCGYNAPSGFTMPDGSVRAIYVMHAECGPEIMSLPHRLTLAGDHRDRLAVEPAGEYEALREKDVHLENIALPAGQEVVLKEVEGSALEIALTVSQRELPCLELRVLRSHDGEEYTAIDFYNHRGGTFFNGTDWLGKSIVAVDCSRASRAGKSIAAPEHCEVLLKDRPLKLRVFVDRSVVEVFANGQGCIGRRVFPEADSITVSLLSCGKDAVVDTLDAYTMRDVNVTFNTDAL